MLQFDHIKNKELSELAKLSESIRALPEAEGQKLLDSLNSLPEEGQKAILDTFREEQLAIQQAKAEKGITPEKELADIKAKTARVKAIKHEFETKVRTIKEKKEKTKSDTAAEQALEEI